MTSAIRINDKIYLTEEEQPHVDSDSPDSAPSLVLDNQAGPVDIQDGLVHSASDSDIPILQAIANTEQVVVNLSFVSGSFNFSTGSEVDDARYSRTAFIPVVPDVEYTFSISGSAPSYDMWFFFYAEDGGLVSFRGVVPSSGFATVIPSGISELRLLLSTTVGTVWQSQMSYMKEVEEESSSTPGSGGTIIIQPEEHPFMTTQFDDYNVTEGLLFVVVVIAVLSIIIAAFKAR